MQILSGGLLVFIALAAGTSPFANETNICGQNATIGNAVIAALNLTYPGLSTVAVAAAKGDLNTACEELADYYRNANTSSWVRVPPVTPGTGMAGGVVDEMVLHDIFYLAGVDITAPVPRNADGGLDWLYKGPRNDVEFMNCLNRFDSWVFLLTAWRQTGNPIYSTYFDAMVKDWVLHLPCPDALSNGKPCVPAGLDGTTCTWEAETSPNAQACKTGTMESPWRSLEMGIRMGAQWPTAFFGFQNAAEFSTTARVLLVLAVSEHNAALAVDGGHPGEGTPNWEMTQWQGLVYSTVAFPELKNTSGLLALALQELSALIQSGVYPDGVETEQASGYDMGTAGDFFGTLQLMHDAGHAPPPQDFVSQVERMWDYGTYISDATGCLPRNGDADLCNSGYWPSATTYFNRGDWQYVHTNGAQGTVPPQLAVQGPSSVFPWAGQIAMRSSYYSNATWIWFDVGPYGSSGHAHRDKLNFLLHARGSMLLADSGRFAYQGTDLSATLHIEYARNTSAHNTLIIDGCDQLPLPALATAPIAAESVVFTPQVDTAYGNMTYYNGLQGSAMHTRAVYYSRSQQPAANGDGDWAVVVDAITSDRPRTIQAFWHTHPNATGTTVDPVSHAAVVGGAYMLTGQPSSAQVCVIPAAGGSIGSSWANASIVRGQVQNLSNGTQWQGWFSASYDDAWPASTIIYTTNVPSQSYFAWLLIPTAERADCTASVSILGVQDAAVQVEVRLTGSAPLNVTVPIGA